MTHEEAIATLLEILHNHKRFVVTSHARPDGDAVGSSLALAEILEQLGHEVDIVFADPVPDIYETLPNVGRIRHARHAGDDPRAVIILECDSTKRTELLGLEGRFIINIDHHASGRDFGSFNWIDENACAVAAMVFRIAVAAKVDITPSMATCLYTSILSDTGSFTYPGTSAETFALAHTLALKGASPSKIARDVLFTSPLSKIKLLGAALSNMECDGAIAWSWVTQQDLDRTGAIPEDCEGVVNHLISIAGVESAVFLRELPTANQFRLSIRSKGRVNVALVAESFGGGGHRTASGCTMEGPLASATGRILKQLRDELC
ncbi:DHH family phosphoesterase [Granulicella arctica]|uniref:Phosphoesterase RecJ-like protein n=1 Tax=Granulicella arctica TaxID=940613 RepID=A0A7Y9PG99_9BACT|nr:bifunctional oligoribonuclease/PAP phosphatase NrnA [Granulicella arctica]NYF79373.1 phosphoesterase RecJ-like protein [Granulicella arctica]